MVVDGYKLQTENCFSANINAERMIALMDGHRLSAHAHQRCVDDCTHLSVLLHCVLLHTVGHINTALPQTAGMNLRGNTVNL